MIESTAPIVAAFFLWFVVIACVLDRRITALSALMCGSGGWLLSEVYLPSLYFGCIFGAVTAVAAWVLLRSAPLESESDASGPTSRRLFSIVIPVGIACAGVLLMRSACEYYPQRLVWERQTVNGFLSYHRFSVPLLAFLRDRLMWGEGLMSSGWDSLWYGGLSYGLLGYFGITLEAVRVASVLFFVVTVLVLFFTVRSESDAATGAATAALFAAHPAALSYARYGTSLMATCAVCAAACAVFLVWRRRAEHSLLAAIAAALVIFGATLNYATGRLFVLGILLCWLAELVRCRTREAALSHAAFAFSLCAIVFIQYRAHALPNFLEVRGEQIFTIAENEMYSDWYYSSEKKEKLIEGSGLWTTGINHLGWALRKNVPALLGFFDPRAQLDTEKFREPLHDPPVLPYLPYLCAPFALAGLCVSFRNHRRPLDRLFLVTFACCVVPLLFTSRIDLHRLALTTIHLAFWTATGARAFVREGRSRMMMRARGAGVAMVLLFSCWIGVAEIMRVQPPHAGTAENCSRAMTRDE